MDYTPELYSIIAKIKKILGDDFQKDLHSLVAIAQKIDSMELSAILEQLGQIKGENFSDTDSLNHIKSALAALATFAKQEDILTAISNINPGDATAANQSSIISSLASKATVANQNTIISSLASKATVAKQENILTAISNINPGDATAANQNTLLQRTGILLDIYPPISMDMIKTQIFSANQQITVTGVVAPLYIQAYNVAYQYFTITQGSVSFDLYFSDKDGNKIYPPLIYCETATFKNRYNGNITLVYAQVLNYS